MKVSYILSPWPKNLPFTNPLLDCLCWTIALLLISGVDSDLIHWWWSDSIRAWSRDFHIDDLGWCKDIIDGTLRSFASFAMISTTFPAWEESRPVVGSSAGNTFGFVTSSRATRCAFHDLLRRREMIITFVSWCGIKAIKYTGNQI